MGLSLLALNYTMGQELQVELKDARPDVYIDGKKYDYSIYKLLDQNKIATVNVLKGDEAIEKYKAENGVILITTKKKADEPVTIVGDQVKVAEGEGEGPMIFIDGVPATKEELQKLSPDKIKTIDVLKGDAAEKKYKAKNGVIIVKTKG